MASARLIVMKNDSGVCKARLSVAGCGRRSVCLVLLTLFVSGFWGCGDIDGVGTDGTYDTGSIIQASISPNYFGQATNQVDIVQDMCVTTEGVEPEPFTDHFADISVVHLTEPNTDEQTASNVVIDAYTITYIPVGSGLPQLADMPIPLEDSFILPPCLAGGEICTPVTHGGIKLMDVATKMEYLTRGGSSTGQGRYNIRYVFYGINLFGERVNFTAETNVTLADYDHCD